MKREAFILMFILSLLAGKVAGQCGVTLPIPVVTFTAQPGAGPVCTGDAVTYTTEASMTSYVWGFPGVLNTDYIITTGGTGSDNTVTLNYLTSGSKTVTINYTNSDGCTAASATSSTATTVNDLPTVTFTAQPGAGPVCTGVAVTYTTEASMTSYVWVFPGVLNTDYSITSGGTGSDNTVTLNYLTSGSKTVTINYTNSDGCTAVSETSSTATTVNDLPTVTFTAQPGAGPVCTGVAVTYTTEASMTSYVWGFPGVLNTDYSITSGGTGSDNTVTLNYLTSGSKTVTVNYTSLGCTAASSASSTATTVNDLPTVTFTAQPGVTNVCVGVDVSYTTQLGMSNYIWGFPGSTPGDYTITSGGTSADNTVTLKYWTAGSKIVTINYTNGGCSATSATSSSATPVDSQSAGGTLASDQSICYGFVPADLELTGKNGNLLRWEESADLGFTIPLTIAGETSTTLPGTAIGPLTSNTYFRAVVKNNNCSEVYSTVVLILIDPLPTLNGVSQVSAICSGATATIHLTGLLANSTSTVNYTVDGIAHSATGVGPAVSGEADFSTVALIPANNGKILEITGIDIPLTGCSQTFTSKTTLLIVNTASVPSISGDETPCINSTIVYSTEPGMTLNSYVWSLSGGGTFTGGGINDNTITITWTATSPPDRILNVNYTNTNGCTAAGPAVKNITVSPLPAPTMTEGPASVCVNSTGNVYTTQLGMTIYDWTVSGGIITSGGDGSNMAVVTWTTTGYINVTYTNISGCTGTSANYGVTVNPLPVPVVLSGPVIARITSAGNTYSTTAGMTNYIWSVSAGGYITGGDGTNTISVTWNTTGAKTISVKYTNTDGCNAVSAIPYNVTVNPLPVAGSVSISAAAEVGIPINGSYLYSDGGSGSQGISIFRWLRNGTEIISGATGSSYTPVLADVDKTITFEVTPVSDQGPPYNGLPVRSSPSLVVEDLTGEPVADEVCIEGIRANLSILKGKYRYTYIKAEGISTYRWLKDGVEIGTGLQYTLNSTDIGDDKEIIFEVTPVSSNRTPQTGLPAISDPFTHFTLAQDEYPVAVNEVILSAYPLGGVFSGREVTDGIYSPSSAGIGIDTLYYFVSIDNPSVTCSQKASKIVEVIDNTTEFDDFKNVYCQSGGNDRIVVKEIPEGAEPFIYMGVYYGFFINDPYLNTGIVSEELTPGAYHEGITPQWAVTIDPTQLNVGNGVDVLYLYYLYNSYYYLLELPLNVESVGTITRINNLNPAYCVGDPVQNITVDGLYPSGGNATWTGTILLDKNQLIARINPAMGTAGQEYTIKYQYTTPNGCLSNEIEEEVQINALPDPSFTLDPTYNVKGGEVTLVGSLQTGGAIVGNGVSGNKLFPDIAGLGNDIITYSITDENGCFSTLTKTTTIREAQGTFTDLPSVICYNDTTYNVKITGLPSGVTINSFTNTKNSIIHASGATNADYSITAAGAGIDTLTFSYKWSGVDYEISKIVNVDHLAQVTIDNLSPGDIICNNDEPMKLYTSYEGGIFTGPVIAGYLDPSKEIGPTAISYKYTNQKTGCSTTVNIPFTIISVPEIAFYAADYCIEGSSDSTRFINTTTSGELINDWSWEFTDASGSEKSSKKEPAYLFRTGGPHPVTLTAKTSANCTVTKVISIDLGVKPVADFYWENECFHPDESLELFDQTISNSSISSRSWNFFDGGPLRTELNPIYPKTTSGYIKVQYIVNTNYANCSDTTTKNIYIRPSVSLASDDYYENFENGNGGWVKNEDRGNSWSFGKPDNSVINKAASGITAWFTDAALINQKIESSSIISPCFDFTSSERPMISLKLWKRFDRDRDGAVLLYKTGDIGTWQPVGTLDDGINWYNSTLIKGRPGGDQMIGWTTKGAQDTEWIESRHTLDELKGKKDVKFRMAYGSDGTSNDNEGIAFDDIWIGKRTRNVLLEHFTNTSDKNSSVATVMVDTISKNNKKDVINIQYHTNFPGNDPYYDGNPGDASARILFYGLIKAPYSFIDGGNNKNDFAISYDYRLADIDGNDVIKRSLVNPKFDISLTTTVSGGILSVSGMLTALEAISSDNITLYLAVTEKENDDHTGANGEKIFYNVFRKFIPDGGGISLKKTWSKGDVVALTDNTWVIEKTLNASDIEVIAFIQNSITKEVYQAASEIKKELVVGIDNLLRGKGGDFALYPNPATDRVTITFKDRLIHEADIRFYDIRGVAVASFKAASGLSEFTIEDHGLRGGIYLVRISTGGIDLGFKKLIISGD